MKTKIKLKQRNIDFMINSLQDKFMFFSETKKERKLFKKILKKLQK